MKAKVFLSCGQNKNSDESAVAERIAQKIDALGFDCYMAIGRQSARSLRDNIFAEIASSDYFIFIDFQRERIGEKDGRPLYRGSLFSHQELAIASFLDIPLLVLQEDGLNTLDGMLGVIQGNAKPFSDKRQLPEAVVGYIDDKIRKEGWSPESRNILSLAVADNPFSDTPLNNGQVGRFFHIAVRNNHRRKVAFDCYAYLEVIENLVTKESTTPKLVEFKWAGTKLPSVRIGPQTNREFDVVRFGLTAPIQPLFWALTDSPDYLPRFSGPGKYRLKFSVQSQNFEGVSADFIFEYGRTHESVIFRKA